MSKRKFAVMAPVVVNGKTKKAGGKMTADDTDPQVRRWWRAGRIVSLEIVDEPKDEVNNDA